MEKTIFLFHRKEGTSRESFARHYVTNHAPLGARLTRCLLGYTVNLVDDAPSPDAITEHWVEHAMDILTPSIAYATTEDFQQVFNDDRSFIGDFQMYVATAQHETVAGTVSAVVGELTGESKYIWFHRDANALPPPPAGARRVVDSVIDRKITYSPQGVPQTLPSDVAIMRSVWGNGVDRADAERSGAIFVREYSYIAVPPWPSS